MKYYIGVISRKKIFSKALLDQNSTSVISIMVVASLSQQQTGTF